MSGRAWRVGDDIDTDAMAPGAYMKSGIETIATHCLETVLPAFAAQARPGDVLVAGRNFGAGSSREQAPQALRHLGLAAVVAVSFAGLFYRNALNLGLPVVACPGAGSVPDGALVEVDPERGLVHVAGQPGPLACEAIPPFLLAMVRAGGLLPHLEAKLRARP